MGHSVSKAADNAVKKSTKPAAGERTPEQVLSDIRKNISAGLAITPDDQRFLFKALETETAARVELARTVGDLTLENQELEKQAAYLTERNAEFRSTSDEGGLSEA